LAKKLAKSLLKGGDMAKQGSYWEPEIETAPIEKLRERQLEKLQELADRAYTKTKFHQRKFDKAGVKPADIKTLEDIQKLPLTDYLDDFVATPLADKLAVPWEDILVFWNTSGTISGSPQLVPVTKNENERIISMVLRFLYMLEATKEDVILLSVPTDVWIIGIERLGAKLIPGTGSAMLPHNQVKLIDKAGVTMMLTLPSFFLQLEELGKGLGIDLRKSKLQKVVFCGEPWAESLRSKMEEEWQVKFYDAYGLAELPGRGGECQVRKGIHLFADYSIIEIVDPETGKVLSPGEEGEIIITNLAGEAMPLIRYRTGDVAKILEYEACPCGRTHPKISRVKGRVDHITKVEGRKILPLDIEEIVATIPDLSGEYQLIVDKAGELHRLKIKAEYVEPVRDLAGLHRKVADELERGLMVSVDVELMPKGELPKTMWKAQRIIRAF